MNGTTTNTTHFPDPVWDAFKDVCPEHSNLSDGLIHAVAEHVLEEHDDLDPEQRQRIKRYTLEGDDG